MSVKDKRTIDAYVANVAAMQAAVEDLKKFLDGLPAPDEHNELRGSIHYGHTGTVGHVRELLDQAAQATKGFWDDDF